MGLRPTKVVVIVTMEQSLRLTTKICRQTEVSGCGGSCTGRRGGKRGEEQKSRGLKIWARQARVCLQVDLYEMNSKRSAWGRACLSEVASVFFKSSLHSEHDRPEREYPFICFDAQFQCSKPEFATFPIWCIDGRRTSSTCSSRLLLVSQDQWAPRLPCSWQTAKPPSGLACPEYRQGRPSACTLAAWRHESGAGYGQETRSDRAAWHKLRCWPSPLDSVDLFSVVWVLASSACRPKPPFVWMKM